MTHTTPFILTAALLAATAATAEQRFYIPMDLSFGQVSEKVSGARIAVDAATVAENLPGIQGQALRMDGYSTTLQTPISLGTLDQYTFSLWTAMETWPIIEHDIQNETDDTMIAGNLDAEAKSGCGFFLNRVGRLSFRFYSGGWPGEIVAPQPLPLYSWNNLVAHSDGKRVTLYNNGVELGSTSCRGVSFDGTFAIGLSPEGGRTMNRFRLDAINGLIDEVEIRDDAVTPTAPAAQTPQLTTASAAKYDTDRLRPRYHGMPVRNWTNETHGLTFYNGRWHLFFQKNANGPYMSRLQWGHLVSDNLYDWEEMPIALASDRWYDLKGCWSGCLFTDDILTGCKPGIIYTGVDYARAMIAQASPLDDNLLTWSKRPNPIIDGRPQGLSDDFRDPYFFRNGDNAYIIVGTSKNNLGAATLHRYNAAAGTWSNDGSIFFQGTNAAIHGTFWEMPNLTPLGDGRWLFTVTPQGLSDGVKVLYWIGTINADGTFTPDNTVPATVEMAGYAKDGYGLLSPSITQVDGKTIALGIVPDKLPSNDNYDLGWAHTYSLPREWSVDASGRLVQKPYAPLEQMREQAYPFTADNDTPAEVGIFAGRQYEVEAHFTVGNGPCGIQLFKNGDSAAYLYYDPATRQLTLDATAIPRLVNDSRVFNGIYTTTLNNSPATGQTLTLRLYVDHSILDIFTSTGEAASVRLFPTDPDGDGVAILPGPGGAAQGTLYTLRETQHSSLTTPPTVNPGTPHTGTYTLDGRRLGTNTAGLAPGLYIIDGQKRLVP